MSRLTRTHRLVVEITFRIQEAGELVLRLDSSLAADAALHELNLDHLSDQDLALLLTNAYSTVRVTTPEQTNQQPKDDN